jgi:hypothetical protein
VTLASTLQDDWGAGMYRGKRAPKNAFYDAINALINDEGLPFKRGGSAYYSDSNAGNTLLAIYDEFLQAGQRTVALSSTHLYALNGTTPVDVNNAIAYTGGRGVGIGGFLVVPGLVQPMFYGGSLKTAPYSTGTVTVTNGSKTVTGAGTSWTANVDAGMILRVGSDSAIGLVASVDTNTQITLRDAWSGTTAAGASYTLVTVSLPSEFTSLIPDHVASVGTPPRLLLTKGTRAYFTGRGTPTTITLATDYHELPQNAQIIGATGVGDTGVLFTVGGVWSIRNMSLDPVDDFGNLQHVVSQINRDLVLWGDTGLAGYGGEVIVPAIDDVYVMGLGGHAEPITGNAVSAEIRPLYRSYVKAGYQPGLAVAYRGHYLLPVLNGLSTLVDVLVCRMDRDAAWTRWSGHAAGLGYTIRAGSSSTASKLLGLASQRVTDLSSTFDPTTSNAQDADATNFDCTITTRDYPTQQAHGFVQRARLRYELTDDGSGATAAPTVALAYSSDADAGAFSTLTDKGLQGGGTGGAVSAGDKYNWWTVGKKRERIRFKITQTGAAASFILRSLEMLTRQSGRQ